MATGVAILGTVCALLVASWFFLYPAFELITLIRDPGVRATGLPSQLPTWFRGTARHYLHWADGYLGASRAEKALQNDVPATEWPLFGSVFFLAAAEELVKAGRLQLDPELEASLDRAADVVASPASAAWVRRKWGEGYLHRENIFYRMLVTLGLSSFEAATGDTRFRTFKEEQGRGLSQELLAAPYHLADDYPDECYPTDVLWAAAAAQRALGRRVRSPTGANDLFGGESRSGTTVEGYLPSDGATRRIPARWRNDEARASVSCLAKKSCHVPRR